MRAAGLSDVRWTSSFWAGRFALARDVVMPEMWKTLQIHGNGACYRNLLIAAGREKGEFKGNNWSDGDVYEWLEGAAMIYEVTRDPALDRLLDEVIATIAAAQQPDGYISTQITVRGKKRWQVPREHEMYNIGHLLTAACIHHRATGKRNLLDVVRRCAGYLYLFFQPRPAHLAHFGVPSNIMGIAGFYRTTRDPRYLELTGTFVDMRGSAPGGTDPFQARVPPRKETQAVGHAVHATYLYAAAADLLGETGEEALRRGYNVTCANIGNALWNYRMLALTGEARYADVMETALYNSMLSGLGLNGKEFFYPNIHRRFNTETHFPHNENLRRWNNATGPGAAESYCCPPNLLRMLAGLHSYAYSLSKDVVWVHLHGSNTFSSPMLELSQKTGCPWGGKVTLTAMAATTGEVELRLRIPAWSAKTRLSVNGSVAAAVKLAQRWDSGLRGGVTVLEGTARARGQRDWAGLLYRRVGSQPSRDVPVRLIPYYAWANRGPSLMTVWNPLAD
jgi:hypothetical protein